MEIKHIPENGNAFINLTIKRESHHDPNNHRHEFYRASSHGFPSKIYSVDWPISQVAEYYIRETRRPGFTYILYPYTVAEDDVYNVMMEVSSC